MDLTKQLTIALPVYKRTDFIRSALDSCQQQTVPCRILLIDNNSPHDDFRTILESYNNPLMQYHRNPETVPQDENFNNCFRYAETPWVTILHDDDMLHCQFAELTGRTMEKLEGSIGGLAVRSHVAEEEWDGVSTKKDLHAVRIRGIKEPYFYFAHLSPFPGVVVKRETALSLGGFTNKLFPIADFDFWYRYSLQEKFYLAEEEMAYYRISSTQSTVDAFYDMITKIYAYRKKLTESSRHNNFLTRLGLEYTRQNNIAYFKRTYPAFEVKNDLTDSSWQKSAARWLKIPLMERFIRRYIKMLSYDRE